MSSRAAATVRVGKGGRITLPATIRRWLDLDEGDTVEISASEGKIDVSRESAEPYLRGEEHPSLVATWDNEADDVYDRA